MRRRIQKLIVTLATAIMATTALVVATAPAAHAADGCTYNSPMTVYQEWVFYSGPPYTTYVQLRANSNQVCAWGRIIGGEVNDLVWVDKSWDGGRTWLQLGITKITSGTSNFTPAYNDQGTLMRACAAPWDWFAGGFYHSPTCTGWW